VKFIKGRVLMGAPKFMSNEAKTFTEVRCAVRFPVQLSVDLETADGKTSALTHNVSANGVLLSSAIPFEINSAINFSMRMPAAILGTPRDVMIHCRGRVVRSYPSSDGFFTAATIDEYLLTDEEASGPSER
jgi:PilZ domain